MTITWTKYYNVNEAASDTTGTHGRLPIAATATKVGASRI